MAPTLAAGREGRVTTCPRDHGAPRDLIDVFAASRRWTNAALEEFGRRHARGRFERENPQSNLTGAEWTDDEAFGAYGLSDATISALRAWAFSGPPTSRPVSSKKPMIRTLTDHFWARRICRRSEQERRERKE